ncbi:hypothetical protein L1049_013480 [Liquidambar formosana]|uniref:Nuclease HARBI1 n=1 Tax=Liquidambar formosana TaxID=63359 RepID=A0AAP0RLI5_LIQFO
MSDDLHIELLLDTSDSNSNSSDDEFEIMAIVALQEELLNAERVSRRHRGSIQGHATKHQNQIKRHNRLYKDYFAENPVYSPIDFLRSFRMRRSLFLRIIEFVEAHDPYFVQKRNAVRVLGLSSLQKVTAAMRMLAYGLAADAVDDYVRISESTAIVSLKRFVKAVI